VEMDQVTEIVGEDGSTKSIKRRETVPCVQIWRKDADSILKACKLTAMTAPGGQQTIDFTTPFLHNEQKIYFERNRPIYLERQFTKIHSEKDHLRGPAFLCDCRPRHEALLRPGQSRSGTPPQCPSRHRRRG
jgi:hypothetical protein